MTIGQGDRLTDVGPDVDLGLGAGAAAAARDQRGCCEGAEQRAREPAPRAAVKKSYGFGGVVNHGQLGAP